MTALCDYPDAPTNKPRTSPGSDYRGPDARELIKEIERQLELLGNPSTCPIRSSETPHNGMDVWASHHPYLHLNVTLPPAR